MTNTLIDGVVRHARSVDITNLHDSTVKAAQKLLLDGLGVGAVGSTTPESVMALETAGTWGVADEARVWGSECRLPAAGAAFVNAHQIHCLEFDAIHEPAVVHPMTVVLPVIAAWAQREKVRGRRVSGAELLRAVIVGVDIAGGLGDVTTTPLQFFRPGTAGALGAIAALTAAARPDHEQGVAAMGVAFGGISGTMQAHTEQTEGAQLLALQVGFNARAALNAWDLAAAGFTGPREVLEGRFGYFALIEAGGRPELLVERLGSQWEVERTSIKPFPSGRAAHNAVGGVLELQRVHGFTEHDVASIEAFVPPMIERLVGRPATEGMTAGSARLCLPLQMAIAVRQGTVDLSSYTRENLTDEMLLAVASRVTVVADDNPDPNAFDPQTVTVVLRSGRTLAITKEASLGSPSEPLSLGALEDKFRANLKLAGREAVADRIIDLVNRVHELDDATDLLELM